MRRLVMFGPLTLILLLLVGCGQSSDIPTRVPKAVVPAKLLPTDTPRIPPTRDLNLPIPTQIPSPTSVIPTRVVTPTPEPETTVNITSPSEGVDVVVGGEVIVGGLAQLGTSESLSVTLTTATGYPLSVVQPEISEFNSWQASLIVPLLASGPAQLRANVVDAAGATVVSDTQDVNLILSSDTSDRYLTLFRPERGATGVSGFNLFFDGRAQRPVNNTVTISIWDQECSVEVASQDFVLAGSGYWQGFLVVPRDVSGPVCAVAYFGTPGEEGWRQAQVNVNVLDATEDNAHGVLIGNPPPNSVLTSGESLLLYGTAHNAPDDQVLVSILLENGRVLTEGVATADVYGYWELSMLIPEDASGPAQINATIGSPGGEDHAQGQNLVTIEPPQ